MIGCLQGCLRRSLKIEQQKKEVRSLKKQDTTKQETRQFFYKKSKQELKALDKILTLSKLSERYTKHLESLILAQDERWRRA